MWNLKGIENGVEYNMYSTSITYMQQQLQKKLYSGSTGFIFKIQGT